MEEFNMDSKLYFQKVLCKVLSADTSSKPNDWSYVRPICGQSGVVALVTNQLCNSTDKKIARIKIGEGYRYFNVIDGEVVDITAEEFGFKEKYNYDEREYVLAEDLLADETVLKRYTILKERFDDFYCRGIYSCDGCGEKHPYKELKWVASYCGLCKDCYQKFLREALTNMEYKKYEFLKKG